MTTGLVQQNIDDILKLSSLVNIGPNVINIPFIHVSPLTDPTTVTKLTARNKI
jgi:hypothetical protein